MNSLPNELLLDIFENLSPLELLKCKILNKQFYKICLFLFKLKIKSSNFFDILPKKSFEILDKKCLMSGPSLLQFLLNEDHKDPDINIFLTEIKFIEFDKILLDNAFIKYEKMNKHTIDEYNSNYNCIKNIYYYTKNNINIILTIVSNVYNYVYGNDLKIIRNFFDGSNCFINYNNLKNKIENISYKQFYKYDQKYIKKYIKRGFTFTIHDKKSQCNYCKNISINIKKCHGCGIAIYCNRVCQRKDRRFHNCLNKEYQDINLDRDFIL